MNRLTTEQVCLSRAAKMVVAYPVGKEWQRVAKSGKSGEKWRKVAPAHPKILCIYLESFLFSLVESRTRV